MITMAGGNYALADVVPEEENALSTMNMQMEDFYNAAQSADILIYNSAIEGEITSIDELLAKNSLFAKEERMKLVVLLLISVAFLVVGFFIIIFSLLFDPSVLNSMMY